MKDKISQIVEIFIQKRQLDAVFFKAFLVSANEGLRAELILYFQQNQQLVISELHVKIERGTPQYKSYFLTNHNFQPFLTTFAV